MRINHNIASLNTNRVLGVNRGNTAKSIEKLSSGLRINKAGDDAAGLAISEKMRGQIRGLNQASRNSQDTISLIQTAEGALTETHSILQRMRELAVQSSNDTNTDADRQELQTEVAQLVSEIDRIANTTEFNTKKLLDGSAKGVADQIKGSAYINNNSTVNIAQAVLTGLSSASANGASGSIINGAYMLIRTGDAALSGFVATDYQIVGPNGVLSPLAAATVSCSDLSITLGTGVMGAAYTIACSSLNAGMKVGDNITLVFNKYEAATTLIDASIMTQIGANSGQNMFISMSDMRASGLGVNVANISTKFGAAVGIETVNGALSKVSHQRANLGAIQNRLEHTVNNLDTASENLQASESRIRDVDMAKEMTEFTKNNILTQAAQAMLAQANQQPQSVLQLLQ